MRSPLNDHVMQTLRWLAATCLLVATIYYFWYSRHWPVIWDSAVLHYINFLIDHGFRPYRDISDSNMPGSYLFERWAVGLFGVGDLSWRFVDYTLSALLTAAFIVIAAPVDWLAGLFAGAFFALIHGSEGPDYAVEREQVMTVLLAISLAALLTSLRRRTPPLMLLFGACCGFAAAVKPTSLPLAIVVLLAAIVPLRRTRQPWFRYVLYALGGFFLALLPVAVFFLQTHSFAGFLWVTRTLLPSYVASRQVTAGTLVRILFPRNLIPLFALGALLLASNRRWRLEQWIVLTATLFGAVSFFLQRKGLIYHRYPFIAFGLLLIALELYPALLGRSLARRVLACLALLSTLGLSLPHYLQEMHRTVGISAIAFTQSLTADLRALGPEQLQRNIECFDLTDGCFSALLHLGIVQSDGFTGDLLFFSPDPGYAGRIYRAQFWQEIHRKPPEVFVLSNEWFQVGHTFRKLSAWPEFRTFLAANYVEVVSRAFPVPGLLPDAYTRDDQPSRYRIYIHKGSPLLKHERLFPELPALGDAGFGDASTGGSS